MDWITLLCFFAGCVVGNLFYRIFVGPKLFPNQYKKED